MPKRRLCLKIPKFKSDKATAKFWDTHSFADYVHNTEPANDLVFKKPRKSARKDDPSKVVKAILRELPNFKQRRPSSQKRKR